ncbi:hypothetical protein [Neoaquamicrobium sediminum]|uniref:hypothetical protein n=1 Tax=Neoaquamicrobium sediminum TaxID=1849104 RepID=UPI004036D3EE
MDQLERDMLSEADEWGQRFERGHEGEQRWERGRRMAAAVLARGSMRQQLDTLSAEYKRLTYKRAKQAQGDGEGEASYTVTPQVSVCHGIPPTHASPANPATHGWTVVDDAAAKEKKRRRRPDGEVSTTLSICLYLPLPPPSLLTRWITRRAPWPRRPLPRARS